MLTVLAKTNKLYSFKHHGFCQSMDTLRDKEMLEKTITTQKIPWIK